jgi:D-3-phosphoglycerate dehydrogenase
VARRCAAFDMQVAVYDPYVQANLIEADGYRSVPDFAAVLAETEILTVHMPLAAESRHLIGKAELAALPGHALVINCARGGIFDEDALHEALTSGGIAGAGIDVLEQEPPLENHPLFGLDNVLLSPHTAGMSQEAAIRMAISTARNALAGIDGKHDPSMIVNREVL